MGAGTIGQAALALNRNYVGIEQMQEYYDLASEGLKGAIVE
jgi:DNA modification methylase